MSYISLADAKLALGIATTDTADDSYIGLLVSAAQAAVDAYCQRTFEAVSATRYFGLEWTEGQTLNLRTDLLTLTGLVNADGVAIPLANVFLYPRNNPPFQFIRLRVTNVWQAVVDGEIAVTGTWGYAASAPPEVQHATRLIVGQLFRDFDRQANPDLHHARGVLTKTIGLLLDALPVAARVILAPYVRHV